MLLSRLRPSVPTWPWTRASRGSRSSRPLGPAGVDDAVPGSAVPARLALRLLQSAVHLPRASDRRALSGDPPGRCSSRTYCDPFDMDRSYVGATPSTLAGRRPLAQFRVKGDGLTNVGADFDPGITIPNSRCNAPIADLVRTWDFSPASRRFADPRALRWRASPEHARGDVEAAGRGAGAGLRCPSLASAGLGFFSFEVQGRRIVGRRRGPGGYRSTCTWDPGRRVAIRPRVQYQRR